MSNIAVRGLRKEYPIGVLAVDGIDLEVNDGEIMVLLGPTGCGKSTVLRLIAGLETPTDGQVLFDGRDIVRLAARERYVAMVFQDLALYPHLSVAENIGFPLAGTDEAIRSARVAEVARQLGVHGLLRRRPTQLSGGQRQRVAMARAIVRQPQAFLLDQPLSSLDAGARDEVRADILGVARGLGVSTVYVTHDHDEALCLADRVAVMRKGRIEQLGTPEQIYADPQRLFVAAFVGSPRMNLIQAAVYAETGERTVLDLGTQTLTVGWDDPRAAVLAAHHSERITVGIRPDAFTVCGGQPRASELRGTVTMVELRGPDALVHLETGCAPTPFLMSQLEFPDAPGELSQLTTEVPPRSQVIRDRLLRLVPQQRSGNGVGRYAVQPAYDAGHDTARQALGDLAVRVPAEQLPRPGDTLSVTVDLDKVYLFDGAGDRINLPAASAVGDRG